MSPDLLTPDGRYQVRLGRLWRCPDPSLPTERRAALQSEVALANGVLAQARRAGDGEGARRARLTLDGVRLALGERGPVWWRDGAPDYNRQLAATTPYAAWYRAALHRDAPERGAF